MKKNSRIFVAGHRGLVGSAIWKSLENKGYSYLIGRTHKELDLEDPAAVREFFDREKPEYVFLAAAFVGGIIANSRYRADFIFREEIARAGLAGTMDQYFAVLTNLRSVGVMGDGRTYDYALALRSVTTSDFMTADWTRIPYEVLDLVSVRVVNEVPHINRVLYDVTSKPPATIEYE